MRQKCSAYRLKRLEPVKHIKLLFSMFRKFFNNPLMGLKLDLMNLRMKKEDDDDTKRFSKSLKTLEPVEHINYYFLSIEKISTTLLWV